MIVQQQKTSVLVTLPAKVRAGLPCQKKPVVMLLGKQEIKSVTLLPALTSSIAMV